MEFQIVVAQDPQTQILISILYHSMLFCMMTGYIIHIITSTSNDNNDDGDDNVDHDGTTNNILILLVLTCRPRDALLYMFHGILDSCCSSNSSNSNIVVIVIQIVIVLPQRLVNASLGAPLLLALAPPYSLLPPAPSSSCSLLPPSLLLLLLRLLRFCFSRSVQSEGGVIEGLASFGLLKCWLRLKSGRVWEGKPLRARQTGCEVESKTPDGFFHRFSPVSLSVLFIALSRFFIAFCRFLFSPPDVSAPVCWARQGHVRGLGSSRL